VQSDMFSGSIIEPPNSILAAENIHPIDLGGF
jgi:hypothetical protein